ncbi:MAG: oligoendopeptidase F family protein [Clostridia bacterium]|nr:oligoendopeptidase F family protein [Clostridia bacterium]
MDNKYNWDLTQIFKNEEDFNNSKNELYKILDKIKKIQGKLCDSAENLYNLYSLYEKAQQLLEKIYPYGMLKYHLDMANQDSIKLFKLVEKIESDFSIAVSYIAPEIINQDEAKIQGFFNEKKELNKYKRDIEEILEKKKYILSKEEENLLSNYSEIFANFENTYDIFTNAELKYGKIKNENGEEVELTDATYTNFLKSQNRNVRKSAFNLMYNTYQKYINTITELYISRVKYSTITSEIRNYKSSLEKAVIHDDASIKVYDTLINTVSKMMNVNHEFISLKKELLKLDSINMYDIYCNPLELEPETITFEQAKEEVLNALSILGEDYIKLLNEAFDNRWIDVYEKENKRARSI